MNRVNGFVQLVTQEVKVAVISGAGGRTVPSLVNELLGRGWKVICLSSQSKESRNPQLTWVKVDRNELENSNEFYRSIAEGAQQLGLEGIDHLAAINWLGDSKPSGGRNLEQINVKVPQAFFDGAQAFGNQKAERTSLTGISSIAAVINDHDQDPYAISRRQHHEDTLGRDGVHHKFLFLPGIVAPQLDQEGRVDMLYEYSPEQLAHLPVIPVVGSGNQRITYIDQAEFNEAIVNGLEAEQPVEGLIHAARDDINQKQLFAHFSRKGRYFAHIPADVAIGFAEHFPYGRFAHYAMHMFARQDREEMRVNTQPFTTLLGREPKSFGEIYPRGSVAIASDSPLIGHAKDVVKKIIYQPQLSGALLGILPGLRNLYFTPIEKS